jgi:hypothetical protein
MSGAFAWPTAFYTTTVAAEVSEAGHAGLGRAEVDAEEVGIC